MPNLVLLRRQMVQVSLRLYERGLIVAGEGNLSIRLSDHHFLVTPAGVAKGRLKPQDLLEIGLSGRNPFGKPTSEWPVHREIYGARPDVCAICHAHPPWATAFSVAGRDLDGTLLTETAKFLPKVPLAARAVPGSEEVAATVVPLLEGSDAVLLGSHGAVTLGIDLEAAFFLMETVERLAQVTLLSELAAGRSSLSEAQIQELTAERS